MEPQSALTLTEQEWQDLAKVCRSYLGNTAWADDPRETDPFVQTIRRCRELCVRVREAV